MKEETKKKVVLGVIIGLVLVIGGGIAYIIKEGLLMKEVEEQNGLGTG